MATKIDLQSVNELGANISRTDSVKSAVKAAQRELCSLNRVIKDCKLANVYPLIADALASVGIKNQKDITMATVQGLIAPEFRKTVTKKVDGEEKDISVVCFVRKVYETEQAYLCNEQGMKLCKVVKGKPVARTQKAVKLDEEGEKVIKGYQLCEIKSWNIQLLIDLLAQSKVLREKRAEVVSDVEE